MAGVIRTDKWLLHDDNQPLKIAKRLKKYFPNAEAEEVLHHLTMFGMSRSAVTKKQIQKMQEANIWKIVAKDYQQLQYDWEGANIPIFILPSDTANYKLKKEFNGKAGLSFNDKIFLFLSEWHTKMEIRALLTHEYNHVCRLTKYNKPESKYTLLDTIILEGMAEYAVYKRLGAEHTASYIGKYSDDVLHRFWNKYIAPKKEVEPESKTYYHLLYGSHLYPKMLGYCVGECLVRTYASKHKLSLKELFMIESEQIAETNIHD